MFFNISAGELVVEDLNYTITFLSQNGSLTHLYQYFKLNSSFAPNFLQITRGNWLLNLTHALTIDTLRDNFSTPEGYSYLIMDIHALTEGGWVTEQLEYNATMSESLAFNISSLIDSAGFSEFHGFYLDVYVNGNLTEYTLYNVTLYDFDDDFYIVNYFNISDTYLYPNASAEVYFRGIDRYVSHIELHNLHEGSWTLLGNETLLNDTASSFSFLKSVVGVHHLYAMFLDEYGNYQTWYLNYSVSASPSLSVAYENPILINENNSISVDIFSHDLITGIWFHNGTAYNLRYNGTGMHLDNFTFGFSSAVVITYSINIKVQTLWNDTFWVNITNLQVIRKVVILDFIGLHSRYYQDDTINVTVAFKDLYNSAIVNRTLNYVITAPNGTTHRNSSSLTDSSGEIDINYAFSVAGWGVGWYNLNVSFTDTTDEYPSTWKMMSFDMHPITYELTDASTANITVRGVGVGSDNHIRLEHINAQSFNFEIDHLGTLTFDLRVSNIRINRSGSHTYEEHVSFTYTMLRADSPITYITFTEARLWNIPRNFSYYYFDHSRSTNYLVDLVRGRLNISDVIGESYLAREQFNVQLRYARLQQKMVQRTETPTISVNSVEFEESFMAGDIPFKHWYFSSPYTINEIVSLTHVRTGDVFTHSDIDIDGNKFKFALNDYSVKDDVFESVIKYAPNWDVSFKVLNDTGTRATVEMRYKADFQVDGVTVFLDLSNESVYYDNWTQGASQDSRTFLLTLTNINFTSSEQVLTLIGVGDVPTASIYDIYSQEGVRIIEGREVNFYGYIEYPKFSQTYDIPVLTTWQAYNVYYGNRTLDVEYVLPDTIRVEGRFNPQVNTSYVHFSAKPFERVTMSRTDNIITITINSTLPLNYPYFMADFSESQQHTLVQVSGPSVIDMSTRTYTGRLTFGLESLEAGLTIIEIEVRYVNPIELLVQGIVLFAVAGAVLAFFYKYQNDDKFRGIVDDNLKKIENRLKRDEKEFKELQEIRLVDGKLEGKGKK